MNTKRYAGIFVAIVVLSTVPSVSFAASSFEVSGWIPYWKVSEGTQEAKENIEVFSEINPFVFTVQTSGALKDLGKLSGSNWKSLFAEARSEGVRIIPTITMGDGDAIHTLLSSSSKRAKHIKYIVAAAKKYDGIEIDYENKKAETREYYSAFLKELKAALGSKMLVCDVEARTPPESLYRTVPANIAYANDLKALNTHCDTVKIMAYDQQRADILLNDSNKGAPYVPVADTAWVKKVVNHMKKDIDASKIIIGIPTYGAEWTLAVAPDWYRSYAKQWALNPVYATDLAKDLSITPSRNGAGELSFTYLPEGSVVAKAKNLSVPKNTPAANLAAAKALAYANKTGETVLVNVVWWSDAVAIKAKADLARTLGVRGIALFKIDGGADQEIWSNGTFR